MSSVENMNTTTDTTDFERLERNTADFIECSKEEIATPSLQAFFDATTERIMKQFVKAFGFQLVEQFRTVYGIEDSVEEISKKVGLDDVAVTRTKATKTTTKAKTTTKKTAAPKWKKPNVPLPWTGERLADPETCLAIRPTQNLFSQCVNKKMDDGKYCKTCQAQADKNETGKPNAGDVEDREAGELFEYTPPGTDKPRKVQQYGNVLEKAQEKEQKKGQDTSKFSRTNVELEATMFGLTIPEEFWAVKKAKRGRKSKSDSEESDAEDKMEKAENSLLDAINAEHDTKETEDEMMGGQFGYDDEDKDTEDEMMGGQFGYDDEDMQGRWRLAPPLPELEEVEDGDDETKKSDDETKKSDDETKKSDDETKKSDDETKKSDDETKKSKKKSKSKKKVSKREKKTILGKYEIKLTRNDDGDKVMWVTCDGTTNEVEGKYTIKNGKVYNSEKNEVTEDMLDAGFEE